MSHSVQATRESVAERTFHCGPLGVRLQAQAADLFEKLSDTLDLYDLTWPGPHRLVSIAAARSGAADDRARGTYLRCARMLVDRCEDGLRATTNSGALAVGTFEERGERWQITVPEALVEAGKLEELEDVLSLVLTTGWRREGWTPIHAAAVVKDSTCAVFCAPTGGGKTTLTAAFVRRGWNVLGDDKLLLRVRDGRPEIAALLHTFNLHPKTREWFPEVGDLELLPRYSVWTEKRKVSVASIWEHAPVRTALPSVLVWLQRGEADGPALMQPLAEREILATLLRQTVIPADPATARAIVSPIAAAAAQLRGVRLEIPADAYRDPAFLERLETALVDAP